MGGEKGRRDVEWGDEQYASKGCLPNPLESEVFLSTKTFADITLPNGANKVARSASVRSLGKW